MSKEAIIGYNRIEDVRWLCSLTESELDLLIGLKEMVIKRATKVKHEALSKNFDLKMLRALGFVLMEHFKGHLEESPNLNLNLTESLASLHESSLSKIDLKDEFGDMGLGEIFSYIGTSKRKRIAEIFTEEIAPKPKKRVEDRSQVK